MNRIHVVDSHTGGEPTRVIVSGGPDLGSGPIQERLDRFRTHFDHIRSAVVNEPRGNDAIVGALLCEPHDPTCQAGVIFFNNVGFPQYVWPRNHRAHGHAGPPRPDRLGRMPHRHQLRSSGSPPQFQRQRHHPQRPQLPQFRRRPARCPGIGKIHGDIAWGGNWFFLVGDHGQQLSLARLEALTDYTWRIRQALEANGITGADGREIDHIELFGPPSTRDADSKNFVLCPGKAYDRSPCGTGTSAKLACLYADGKLKPGETWRQESIVGSVFEGSVAIEDGKLYPEITGYAYVNAESDLILDEADPFCFGIRASCAQATT